MKSICGINCEDCNNYQSGICKNCEKTKACPFSKKCFIGQYIEVGGKEKYLEFKQKLIDEFNELKIEGLRKVDELYPLNGSYVNLAYPLPSGECIKFLDDNEIYLGNQIENEFGEAYFGLLANMSFLLVCEYKEKGLDPDIILFKRR